MSPGKNVNFEKLGKSSELKSYDKKIFRLFFILNKLSEGGSVTTRELTREFNVTPRTVQRDIAILNGTGFLIDSDKGIHSFAEGFSLKEVGLTDEEATLLSFLYEITKSLGDNFKESFTRVLKKVFSENYETPFYAKIPHGLKLDKGPMVKELVTAINNFQKAVVHYKAGDKEGEYKICPLKIANFEGFWYLFVLVEGRDGIIKFRLDHIKGVDLLDEDFEPPDNLLVMLEESTNVWFTGKRDKKVLLRVDEVAAQYFKKKIYVPNQKIKQENKDGSIVVETMVSNNMEVISPIFYWIPHVLVIEPKELRDEIKKIVGEFLKRF